MVVTTHHGDSTYIELFKNSPAVRSGEIQNASVDVLGVTARRPCLPAELDHVALRDSFMSAASSLTTSRNYCHEFLKVMSATTVKLLRAAAEIVGGEEALSERLGIAETLLAKFMADICELPDQLLLRTVDIILEDRQSRLPVPDSRAIS